MRGAAGIAGRGTGALARLSQQMSPLGVAGEELDPRENPREKEESVKDTCRRNLMDATRSIPHFSYFGMLGFCAWNGNGKL